MELRHFRYFEAVARHSHFGRAADELHTVQSSVSAQIKDLEAELGVALLERTTRQVRVTPAGALFLDEVRGILDRCDQAVQLAQRASRGEAGVLGIGYLCSAVSPFLPDMIREYREAFPGIEIQLHELSPEEQVRAFREDRIQLGLTRPLGNSEIEEEVLYSDHIVAALPIHHPLASKSAVNVSSLALEPFVLIDRNVLPGLFDVVTAFCRSAGFSPQVVRQPASIQTVLTLVASGAGVSLVPGCVHKLHMPGLAFRKIRPSSPEVPLVMAWSRQGSSPLGEGFRTILRRHRLAIERDLRFRA